MDNVVTWNVSQYAMLGVLLGFFGIVGFRRGVRRELASLLGIGLAFLIVTYMVGSLVPQVNRIYRLGHFALDGGLGAENPAVVWEQTQDLPALVSGQGDEQLLGVVVFLLLVFLAYVFGGRFVARPYSFFLRTLGFFVGMFNGFLVAIYLLPVAFPEPTAMVSLPGAAVQATLTSKQTVARAVTLLVFVVIALGLYGASGRGSFEE